jgi:hypothetical protein
MLPGPSTVVQEGDLVHAAFPMERLHEVTAAFAAGPAAEES